MTEQELKNLLEDMSLEEKVNQLLQLPGSFLKTDAAITGGMDHGKFSEAQISQAGSVLGIFGAETIQKIQREHMKKQPHHIPLLFMLDVIHGLRTIFPIPLAQGASFRPELAEDCASAAALESAVSGVHVTFAPMADLVRDARWGRVMESPGEDPYLNSLMTAAMVRGFQGKDVKAPGKVASCVKHFAAYGAPEAGREYYHAELSSHTLQEYYLPAYRAGIEEGCEMMMSSFNTLNGVPCTGSKWLLRDVLREDMGFDGVLISDWGSIEEMIPHGYCEDKKEAAHRAIAAGVDIDMCTDVYANSLTELVESGAVDEKLVDEAVLRVLRLKNKLGLFENPYKDADKVKEVQVILSEEHRALARAGARETFVLLKNEVVDENPILPLNLGKTMAFIGPYVDSGDLHGAWGIAGSALDAVSVRAAAMKMLPEARITFCEGCSPVEGKEYLSRHVGDPHPEKYTDEKESRLLKEAVDAAKAADTAVLFLGEHRLQSGEGASRGFIQIPELQMELFRRVCEVNSNVTVVLFNGRPLDLREISENAKAVLEVWLPGTEGGSAIMDVITGASEPAGRLPMSFPYSVGQVPVYYNNYATGRPKQGKDDPAFYTSRYLDIPNEPLYPFGYGLSYTTFELSSVSLSNDRLSKGAEGIEAWIDVTNIGSRPGTETLQLYIRDRFASAVRPVKELKGFQKVDLVPGETKRITFKIREEMLRFYMPDGTFDSEPGIFELWIGNSSQTDNQAVFRLV